MRVRFLLFFLPALGEWSLGRCLILIFRSFFITPPHPIHPPSSSTAPPPKSSITISGLFVFLPKPLAQLVLTVFLPMALSEVVPSKSRGHLHVNASWADKLRQKSLHAYSIFNVSKKYSDLISTQNQYVQIVHLICCSSD